MRFHLNLVRLGQRYGRFDALVNSDAPMLEFYDADYAGDARFGPLGQFVSRYSVATLQADRARLESSGLDLQGDVPVWKLSGGQMVEVFAWLAAAGL